MELVLLLLRFSEENLRKMTFAGPTRFFLFFSVNARVSREHSLTQMINRRLFFVPMIG
jgi:hypothetical protein